jgi:transglutaminase-like putative cysteine protease
MSLDTITITPILEFGIGFIPTSLYTTTLSIVSQMNYLPVQYSFFSTSAFSSSYTFSTAQFIFDSELLDTGQVIHQEDCLQLPAVITERTRELAEQIVEGLVTPYEKAKAIETYLLTNYDYDVGYERAPEGIEPVDWFLFEERKGVCSNFNSALVVLARSVGIPARLVTGYAITPKADEQEVTARQAHAWAEVPFVYFGWITFDATPPDYVPITTDEIRKSGIKTDTEITTTNTIVKKGYILEVEGMVTTVDGRGVDGITVEIFVNSTKTKGGLLIGEGQTLQGRFNIDCHIKK